MGATSNKYNSRINSFLGVDHYNLVLTTVPPADLTLLTAAFTTPYLFYRFGTGNIAVGFNKIDKPYIRGLGLFCNLADGLVLAAASNGAPSFGASGFALRLQLERFGAALTGTISNTAGNAAVVGVGTLFTQEVAVGQTIVWLDDNGITRLGVVSVVTDDLNLTLSAVTASTGMFTANTAAKTAYPLIGNAGSSIDIRLLTLNELYPYSFFLGDVSQVKTPQGVMSVGAASTAVTGFGTAFLTDFTAGQAFAYTDDNGVRRTGHIASIASDTAMTLTANALTAATRQAFLAYDHHLRIRSIIPVAFLVNMITVDPAFSAKRISIHSMAEIEHSLETAQTIS